jgi:hypothetical protein
MIRLTQAIVAVMACTVASGAAGGIVGATVGTFAPGFVLWLEGMGPGGRFDPAEFGLGLGIVSGLFFGAGVGSLLVLGLAWRDAWLARAGILPSKLPIEQESIRHSHFSQGTETWERV